MFGDINTLGAAKRIMVGALLVVAACSETEQKPNEDASPTNARGKPLEPADLGVQVHERLRCGACHSLDGKQLVGPTFRGIYGKTVRLADGSSVERTDEYLKRSITNPRADVVEGYRPTMLSYKNLTDEELDGLVALIRSLE